MCKIEGAIGYYQIMSSQQSPPVAQGLMCGKMHCKQGLHTVNYNTSGGARELNVRMDPLRMQHRISMIILMLTTFTIIGEISCSQKIGIPHFFQPCLGQRLSLDVEHTAPSSSFLRI